MKKSYYAHTLIVNPIANQTEDSLREYKKNGVDHTESIIVVQHLVVD